MRGEEEEEEEEGSLEPQTHDGPPCTSQIYKINDAHGDSNSHTCGSSCRCAHCGRHVGHASHTGASSPSPAPPPPSPLLPLEYLETSLC